MGPPLAAIAPSTTVAEPPEMAAPPTAAAEPPEMVTTPTAAAEPPEMATPPTTVAEPPEMAASHTASDDCPPPTVTTSTEEGKDELAERRLDPEGSGQLFTKAEFVDFYGSTTEWDAAGSSAALAGPGPNAEENTTPSTQEPPMPRRLPPLR